jgi:hypothetical protein
MMHPGAGCPDCRDTGIISRPYIAGVVSTMTACTCDAGLAFLAEWDRQSAALRERDAKARAEQEQRAAEARDRRAKERNAELPEATSDMLKLKGMTP